MRLGISSRKSEEFLAAMSKGLSKIEKFKKLAEQVGKNRVMENKLEALGNRLLIQGVISGAAVTTLTGTLAGLLTVGGVTGALIIGGAALAGFVALVAIAAIGYAIYQHRGEIKEGAIEAGKAVKSFVKNIIDKLPEVQARENNFSRLKTNVLETITNISLKDHTDVNIKEFLADRKKILEMLQNEGQRSAIQELVKNGTIENFSEDDMSRLMNKGLSTHVADMERSKDTEESKKKGFHILMNEFQPAIMAIGSDIKEVEQKVNEKAQEMKPYSQVDSPSPERVSEEGIKKEI
ncbi:glycine zipper family protein [Wolbachia endosymbiont of Oedothorax gibbosus]|uniref:glycine zipper family protein n=1 Tax=Wolbachia endosymbiont of Oedothorax gibbosus TaxID=931100 RepID=UPI0020244FB2|nr:glycine zipper family protein [Wolbachia endosymbiont of Oedothorax gibbosus]